MDDPETRELFVESWPKKCSCGVTYDEAAWESWHYVGVQKGIANHGIPDLELRTCPCCGSTMAVAVPNDFV